MSTNFFISCKESRIESNRSFYGCFTLGPFEAGQSLTVANALRRILLSECSGLGITSVTIENVSHEYSTLPGMRESVLDLLLNLKEIVLKKKKNTYAYFDANQKNTSLLFNWNKLSRPTLRYLLPKESKSEANPDLDPEAFASTPPPFRLRATALPFGLCFALLRFCEAKQNRRGAKAKRSPNPFGFPEEEAVGAMLRCYPKGKRQPFGLCVAKAKHSPRAMLRCQRQPFGLEASPNRCLPLANGLFETVREKPVFSKKNLYSIKNSIKNRKIKLLKQQALLAVQHLETPFLLRQTKRSKPSRSKGTSFFKPVSGFLKVKGPGVIRAKDLKLPPFVECVDPEQYIATLAEDGFLCMKFIIMEGKGYFIQKNNTYIDDRFLKKRTQFLKNFTKMCTTTPLSQRKYPSINRTALVKQAPCINDVGGKTSLGLITKESKALCSCLFRRKVAKQNIAPSVSTFVLLRSKSKGLSNRRDIGGLASLCSRAGGKPFPYGLYPTPPSGLLETARGGRVEAVREGGVKVRGKSGVKFQPKHTLNLDTIFNPVTKISYMIENFDNKIVNDSHKNLFFLNNLCSLLESSSYLKKNLPFLTQEISTNIQENTILSSLLINNKSVDEVATLYASDRNEVKKLEAKSNVYNLSTFLESYSTPEIQQLSNYLQPLKKESPLHSIVLEIWTNGSLHPREALAMAFQTLTSVFLNLQKTKTYSSIYKNESSYQKKLTVSLPISNLEYAKDSPKDTFSLLPEKARLSSFSLLAKQESLRGATFEQREAIPLIESNREVDSFLDQNVLSDKNLGSSIKNKDPKENKDHKKMSATSTSLLLSSPNSNIKNFDKNLPASQILNKGIEFLNIPLRPYTILKRSDIHKISDLCKLTMNDLESIFVNVDKKYLIMVVNSLNKIMMINDDYNHH